MKLTDKNNFEIHGPRKVAVGKVHNYGEFKPHNFKLYKTFINESGNQLELCFQNHWYIYIHAKDIVSTQWLLEIKDKIDKDFLNKTYQDILDFDFCQAHRIQ